jgi:adenine-specific DNA-methyltransferase
MDESKNAFHWGPTNPHPLSKMRTELVWDGKYDEFGNRREVDVAACAMPMQKIETVDEPRQRAAAEGNLELFEKQLGGKKRDDFRNRLIWGDNKLVMASLLKEFKGRIDLIYIDPPFDVGADFTMEVPIGEGKETVAKDQSTLEMVAYRDMWGKGTDSYLHMMFERLSLMKDLLSEEGSIYVHVGPNVSHYIKAVLDDVFGSDNYHSEIVWRRSNSHNKLTDQYGPIHDVILFYSKTSKFKFHPGTTPFSRAYIEERFKYKDSRGIYQPNYLTGPGKRKGESGLPWHGYDPTKVGRHWAIPAKMRDLLTVDTSAMTTQQILDECLKADLLVIPKKEGGQPMYRQYLNEGVPFQDVWAYQPNTKGVLYGSEACIDDDVKWLEQEEEKLGYNTQKPEGLVERILATSTDDGDLVADFFCGSGTTGATAERMGRRWVMSDLGRFATHTSRKRLIELQRKLHDDSQPYRAFDVYNLGRYERQWWQKERLKGAEEEHRRVVLEFFKAEVLTTPPSPILHGRKAGAFCHVDGIDGIFTRDEARAVADATVQAGGREVYCLAWEFEMELRQHCLALEAEFKIKMKLVPIPREIMEKNRKSPPPFLEMAVLEAESVQRTAGGKQSLDVKLTKFLPSLAEVPTKELEALKERAVKSGFDFIDFWAVDFDWHPGKPFNQDWQDYRTRQDRSLKTVSDAGHTYEKAGKHTVCVKVVDVFGCDTSITLEVTI